MPSPPSPLSREGDGVSGSEEERPVTTDSIAPAPPAPFRTPVEPTPSIVLDAKIPDGPIEQKWEKHKFEMQLVNPANKRRYTIICVGTGLAGGGAAATLAELGYNVKAFCYQDSPRRAHSIAAQGGINASKNYRNDGDSIYRLFYDTVKGGDFRAREGNVYRLAEISGNIIDQCVAQGVPFAREYGGLLDTRSFGGALVSRTFYARGQTGQQLLLGAYQALERQIGLGKVADVRPPRDARSDRGGRPGGRHRHPRHGDRRDRGAPRRRRGDGDRRLRQRLLPLDDGEGVQRHGDLAGPYARAPPSPTRATPRSTRPASRWHGSYQSKLTLMSESLRNDGRVWVPKTPGDTRSPDQIPESERDYYLERKYPSYGNLAPRDIASRAAKEACDDGRGVGPGGLGVYLDFSEATRRLGANVIRERYGNLFDMYNRITGEDPYKVPMRIYPAVHYTMGGLWVDYNLMSTIPGLFVGGEANFSDHGANRLGASALMQGLADGYFILPMTVGDYLAKNRQSSVTMDHPAVSEALNEVEARTKRLLGDQRHAGPSTRSTASWAGSCGSTAGWPARTPACARRSR